jgi:uncharacterized membrane protein YfcA
MNVDLFSLQALLCCLAFFFAGIVDSITGGGGLITIPVMLATGIPVHYITGTNQCSAWIGSGVASYKFVRSGNIHLRSAFITLPFAIIGSYIGARLNLIVPDRYLKVFMLVTIPIIAVFIFSNKQLGEEDHSDEQSTMAIVLWSVFIGLVLGGYQGFYGPGSGLFFMLAYAACLKLDLVKATGNTRFVIAIASIASVFAYASSGNVLWNLSIILNVFYIIGSYLGAVLVIRNGARIIRPIMICVVGLLIIKIVFDMV